MYMLLSRPCVHVSMSYHVHAPCHMMLMTLFLFSQSRATLHSCACARCGRCCESTQSQMQIPELRNESTEQQHRAVRDGFIYKGNLNTRSDIVRF